MGTAKDAGVKRAAVQRSKLGRLRENIQLNILGTATSTSFLPQPAYEQAEHIYKSFMVSSTELLFRLPVYSTRR